jgi:Flp pilus assembly protein CpaB
MNRKKLGYILLGTGVALAFIVGAVVYMRVDEANRAIASLPKQRVVIARVDIPERSEIAASMIATEVIPDSAIPSGAARRPEEVVGKFSPTTIARGEVINSSKIGPVAAKNAPSYAIEKGKVMYAMPLQLKGQDPFSILQINALRPGDRVDFIYTTFTLPDNLTPEQVALVRDSSTANFLQTRFLLQNIRVQQVGTFDEAGKNVASLSYMIMVVTPEEALVMKWLKDAVGSFGNSIEMVLRSPGDEEKVPPDLVVNLNYMRQKYGLPEPPRISR